MLPNSFLAEDLPRLAAEAFELSRHHCGSCRNFHALWPYLRIARISNAVEAGRPILESLLADLFEGGHRKILVAGAADTGVPALIARAGAPYGITMVVLDCCNTPLELNRHFFKRLSVPIETMLQDLKELDVAGEFDIVLAHSVLQMITPDCRKDVLLRLGRALRPKGQLLNLYNTGQRMTGGLLPEYLGNYARWVIDELDRLRVSLPERREAFFARLNAYAQERQAREGAFRNADEVDTLMQEAGFRIKHRSEIETNLASPMLTFVSKVSRRRYVTIAEPL